MNAYIYSIRTYAHTYAHTHMHTHTCTGALLMRTTGHEEVELQPAFLLFLPPRRRGIRSRLIMRHPALHAPDTHVATRRWILHIFWHALLCRAAARHFVSLAGPFPRGWCGNKCARAHTHTQTHTHTNQTRGSTPCAGSILRIYFCQSLAYGLD